MCNGPNAAYLLDELIAAIEADAGSRCEDDTAFRARTSENGTRIKRIERVYTDSVLVNERWNGFYDAKMQRKEGLLYLRFFESLR